MHLTPHLAITMGDPNGIGAEVLLKSLANKDILQGCEVTIIGSYWVLEKTYNHLLSLGNISPEKLANPKNLQVIDRTFEDNLNFGHGNAISGDSSFDYLKSAISLTNDGLFQGIVTAPIAKSLWKKAGHDFPGQTEVLAQYSGVNRFGMLFAAISPHTGWNLRCLLATTHIPLADVTTTLNSDLMSWKLDLLIESLKTDFGISNPIIAISGLNPHSGEGGQLGTEEIDWLFDWLEKAKIKYPQTKLIGLIPPDTMWVKPGQAWFNNSKNNVADAYLALYHDQGLIPVKLMAFDRAVNVTIGLPFIRTSPDHGTAFDIAGKGIADSNSMESAISLAIDIIKCRNTNSINN